MNDNSASLASLNIEVTGQGRTVVFSHGVGNDTTVWADFLPVLADQYRVVAWDQPGHGKSAAVDASAYGAELAYRSLARAVGNGEEIILVGHSLGGYLSARFTIEHPDRVAALVMLATGPGFRSPESMAGWNADVTRNAEKQNRPETLIGLHSDTYVMDHLSEIACPSMVMVGSRDKAFVGATDYLEKKVTGIERITIPDAGHMVPATHGTELAGLIAEFLARRLPESPSQGATL